MTGSFFDAIAVGVPIETGAHLFTADDIKRFAAKYDCQAFHLDETAAKASVLGGLCASGWQTAAVSMRLNVDWQREVAVRWVAAGGKAPRFGPSPGITHLRWPKPVYAGDTVTFTQTVTDKRRSASRPGWGVNAFSTVGVNQNGVIVFGFEAAVFISTD